MPSNRLTVFGGEFAAPDREAAFQAERLPETRRHARLILAITGFVYALVIASDWSYGDRAEFWMTLPFRLVIIATSFGSFLVARGVATFPRLERILLAWALVTTVAVAVICSLRPAIAPVVTLILPAIYLLVVPMSFRWTVISAFSCAAALLSASILPATSLLPLPLAMIVLTMNAALTLLLVHGNRLRRMQWTAAEAGGRANDELAESRRLFETMFKAVPIPIVVSRQGNGQIVDANDAAWSFFGFPKRADLAAYSTRDLIDGSARRRVQSLLNREGLVRDFEVSVNGVGGERHDILLSVANVEVNGAPCMISSLVDITGRKVIEERIRQAAHHDALTGLPNRSLFQSTLDAALSDAEASAGRVGLILLDLDAFKEINDTLGHEAGDALLREVGLRLSGALGPEDFVARLGGDEFVIIVACDPDAAQASRRVHALAETILTVLNPAMPIGGRVVVPRASLGLAVFPDHAGHAADLFTNADLALYAAKAAGRNQATLFVPALRETIEARVAIVREAQVALEHGCIVPFYQPKICLATGEVVGFEALARWRHPTRGLLTPAAFAAVFDDPGIGMPLGRCLMRQICADLAGWVGRGFEPGRVFLNLSSVQFGQHDLAEIILAELAQAGLSHDRIGVEVTESVLLGGHGDRVAQVLETLHRAGIRVALDDFGTGYASLTHLKQYPVDEIKVDRSFVRDLERDADDAAIVTAVIQLGRSLGLDVTAEGVETPAQATFLEKRGCAYAQGYLYAKPMAESRVPWFLENRPDRIFDAAPPTDILRLA